MSAENEFRLPDWSAPLDVEEQRLNAPKDGWVRGMFFQEIAKRASEKADRRVGRERYVGFKAYSLREYLDLLLEAASVLHPDEPQREGLRRLGHLGYPTFVSSTVGRVIFSVAGDLVTALSLAAHAYKVAVYPGRVTVRSDGERAAIAELRQMWSFVDSYQVGVFEGAMMAFGMVGEVRVRLLNPHEADLRIEWEPKH